MLYIQLMTDLFFSELEYGIVTKGIAIAMK